MTEKSAPAAAVSPRPQRPITGLEIAALICATLVPVVGLVLGVLAVSATAARTGRASGMAKVATIVSSILIALVIGAIIAAIVAVNNAVALAKNAPFCAAAHEHAVLLSPAGPASLYIPMYNGDFDSFEDRLQQTEAYWNANLSQISAWYDEWIALSGSAPDDEMLLISLQEEATILDPSTGPYGLSNPAVDSKDWAFVSLYVDDVNAWTSEHCG